MWYNDSQSHYMFGHPENGTSNGGKSADDNDNDGPDGPDEAGCLYLVGIVVVGPFLVMFWFLFG